MRELLNTYPTMYERVVNQLLSTGSRGQCLVLLGREAAQERRPRRTGSSSIGKNISETHLGGLEKEERNEERRRKRRIKKSGGGRGVK